MVLKLYKKKNQKMFEIIFYLVSIFIVFTACVVAFSKRLIYSAFSLVGTFTGIAIIYILLGADFLAFTQIIIYIGGILVLILFGVMLTKNASNPVAKNIQLITGIIVSLLIFVIIIVVIKRSNYEIIDSIISPTTNKIGSLFMKEYVAPFEISSILLLLALIGAAYLARKDKNK